MQKKMDTYLAKDRCAKVDLNYDYRIIKRILDKALTYAII